VSPVKYELGFYIPEDDILQSQRREHLKSYMEADLVSDKMFAGTYNCRDGLRPETRRF
jgi:hypothetical protein